MNKNVYVAGVGIISAIGNNVTETILSFENHYSGIALVEYLATKHRNEFPLGEVKLSNKDLAEQNKLDPCLSRTIY